MPWWRLVPLHAPWDAPVALPKKGSFSIGRRPTNDLLCKDLAVSGQHCLVHCFSVDAEGLQLEDCSTNGTWVNNIKLCKGQRQKLAGGDVVSLTKAVEEDGIISPSPPLVRVQFRVEFMEGSFLNEAVGSVPVAAGRSLAGGARGGACNVDPTPPASDGHRQRSPTPPEGQNGGDERNNFAQDLLVQEQKSKAKLTSDLLLSQRKLQEEKQSAEALVHELQQARLAAEEERARRREAEEGRDRLAAEVEALRAERRQLQEMRANHEGLQERNSKTEGDLQEKMQRCSQLEAEQKQLREEVHRAMEAHQRASRQLAEVTTRTRQTQERAERLEQQHVEARKNVERAMEESARLEQELAEESTSRSRLEEQVARSMELVAEAEAAERHSREALDEATAKRAELECQASSAHADAEAARAGVRQAQQLLSVSRARAERVKDEGATLATELRRRGDLWEKALADSALAGLEEALLSSPSVRHQATARVVSVSCSHAGEEEEETTRQHEDEHYQDTDGDAEEDDERKEEMQAAVEGGAAAGAVEEGKGRDELKDEGDGHLAADAGPGPRVEQQPAIALGLDEGESVEAAELAGAADVNPPAQPAAGSILADRQAEDSRAVPNNAAGGATALDGTGHEVPFSVGTAWSLEVLEVVDAPAAKRQRLSEAS